MARRLTRTSAISGRVFGPGGEPVEHAVVTATNAAIAITHKEAVDAQHSVADAHGAYRIGKLLPGTYWLTVGPPPGYVVPQPASINVKANEEVRHDFFLAIGAQPGSSSSPTGPSGPISSPGTPGTTSTTGPAGSPGPGGVSSPGGSGSGISSIPGPTGLSAPGGTTGPSSSGGDDVSDLFQTLESADLSIEAPVSEQEALEAIDLFSIANVYLGSVSTRRVGNQDKMDVLGMLTLLYGLQDKSLPAKIVIRAPQLWVEVQDELRALRDDLEILGSDVVFLAQEARRQFNLGFNHDVAGNLEFPALFQRYVQIGGDPLLALDLAVEEASSFSDKTQVANAYDLLSELKTVILDLVRTLSHNGTVATSQVNGQWANYSYRAFNVLKKVADARVSDDPDDSRILTVIADLTGKDFSTEVAPYIALAREGGTLLQLAMEAYQGSVDQLDNYSRGALLSLFQAGSQEDFLTTRIRNSCLVVKKYPLRGWGAAA